MSKRVCRSAAAVTLGHRYRDTHHGVEVVVVFDIMVIASNIYNTRLPSKLDEHYNDV